MLKAVCVASSLIVLTSCGLSTEVSPQLVPTEVVEFRDERENPLQAELGLIPGQALTVLPAPRLEVTDEVRRELATYLARNGASVRIALERRDSDYRVAKDIFRDEGLPAELLNLAVIESGFRAEAVSPMGARGLWQFTKDTARRWGIGFCKVRGDLRTDTALSTLAAARYLKALYAQFDNWYLALVAYNSGEYAIEKTIEKSNEKSFWTLARKGLLAGETARFVPKFIAVTIIDKLRDRYGDDDLKSKLALHLRTDYLQGGGRLATIFSDTHIG